MLFFHSPAITCSWLFIFISSRFNLSTAIGVTNQRETTLVWDKETGEPLYNAIGKYYYHHIIYAQGWTGHLEHWEFFPVGRWTMWTLWMIVHFHILRRPSQMAARPTWVKMKIYLACSGLSAAGCNSARQWQNDWNGQSNQRRLDWHWHCSYKPSRNSCTMLLNTWRMFSCLHLTSQCYLCYV